MKFVPMRGIAEKVDDWGPIKFVAFDRQHAFDRWASLFIFYPNGKAIKGKAVAAFGEDVREAWSAAQSFLRSEDLV